MSNRGRHKKIYVTKTVRGWKLLHYKLTHECASKHYQIFLSKLYIIYLNKFNQICRIEEDIKNHLNI